MWIGFNPNFSRIDAFSNPQSNPCLTDKKRNLYSKIQYFLCFNWSFITWEVNTFHFLYVLYSIAPDRVQIKCNKHLPKIFVEKFWDFEVKIGLKPGLDCNPFILDWIQSLFFLEDWGLDWILIFRQGLGIGLNPKILDWSIHWIYYFCCIQDVFGSNIICRHLSISTCIFQHALRLLLFCFNLPCIFWQ